VERGIKGVRLIIASSFLFDIVAYICYNIHQIPVSGAINEKNDDLSA
jgi:hypothetical protein